MQLRVKRNFSTTNPEDFFATTPEGYPLSIPENYPLKILSPKKKGGKGGVVEFRLLNI